MGGYVDVSTEVGIRAERFPLLLDSFLENPFFGGTYHNQHLYFMNKFAMLGLLGTLPFIAFLISHVKANMKYFNKVFTFYYLISLFSFIALGLFKALFGREIWYMFFLILPAISHIDFLPLISMKALTLKIKTNENRPT